MQEWATLERLTEAAYTAALKGEWNVAIAYYRQREVVLQEVELPEGVRERLLARDQEVAGLIRTAKAGIGALLQDVGVRRHRLGQLRRRLGEGEVFSPFIEREG